MKNNTVKNILSISIFLIFIITYSTCRLLNHYDEICRYSTIKTLTLIGFLMNLDLSTKVIDKSNQSNPIVLIQELNDDFIIISITDKESREWNSIVLEKQRPSPLIYRIFMIKQKNYLSFCNTGNIYLISAPSNANMLRSVLLEALHNHKKYKIQCNEKKVLSEVISRESIPSAHLDKVWGR